MGWQDNFCHLPIQVIPKWTKGSNAEMLAEIQSQLEYPQEGSIQGVIVLQITIDTFGKVQNPKIIRSISKDLDKQLLECINQYDFLPGSVNGRKVPVQLNLPFKIKIE